MSVRRRWGRSLRAAVGAATLAATAGLAGCGGPVDPDDVTATGEWRLEFELAPSDFSLDLVEAPDGTITGTWSFPSLFAFHPVRGRRDGLEVKLSAASPNIFPAQITARFLSRSRMEGRFYFGGTEEPIQLLRGARPPP